MAKVLLCDDEVMNRKVASKILNKEGFEVVEACDGSEALERLKEEPFDLILMDLMMPVMDGYEATKRIKEDLDFGTIPLIIISALSDKAAITKGLELGADEYLTKPFDIIEFRLRVKNAIKLGSYQNMLKNHKKILEEEVAKKTQELQRSEQDVIAILAKTAEFRDNETSMHTVRVGEMAAFIAKEIGFKPADVELIRLAAPMHDIGKIGIPDHILLKPGKLTDEEFTIMKDHARIGYEILSQKETPLLQMAAEIANTHHEKYDGSGYPNGLKGDAIAMSGAIVAVVDVFDALLSERPYKKPFSLEKTIAIIEGDAGRHFHPDVVALFSKNIEALITIREQLKDV